MFILIDNTIPNQAKINLANYGQLIEMEPNTSTYDAISSHPDIFCCQTVSQLIIAPNITSNIIDCFNINNIKYSLGQNAIGKQYPQTSHYNAVIAGNYLIHNIKHTDNRIVDLSVDKKIISINQSYTRCNLVYLGENNYLTSDKGIYKTLLNYHFNILYINPSEIILPGVNNGFIGGCCGVYENNLFITGNLDYLSDGNAIKEFTSFLGINLIELYDGPLYDGGSIFFIKN